MVGDEQSAKVVADDAFINAHHELRDKRQRQPDERDDRASCVGARNEERREQHRDDRRDEPQVSRERAQLVPAGDKRKAEGAQHHWK